MNSFCVYLEGCDENVGAFVDVGKDSFLQLVELFDVTFVRVSCLGAIHNLTATSCSAMDRHPVSQVMLTGDRGDAQGREIQR